MKKYTVEESQNIINAYVKKLKAAVKKKEILIEYYELDLEEPILTRLRCAHIKTPDNKEAVLYSKFPEYFFHIKMGVFKGEQIPVLSMLHDQSIKYFPKRIINKMTDVWANKKDMKLDLIDFETAFKLRKP
jgi:hypothetical protein